VDGPDERPNDPAATSQATNVGGILRVVLDANVLYPAFLRDVFLRLAASDVYVPHWTARLHEEWIRNVLRNRPDLAEVRLERTRTSMDAHFPGALVTGYEDLERRFPGVEARDRHVAAAALKVGASRIVTANLKDFPTADLQAFGILTRHPDEFLSELIRSDLTTVRTVLESHRVGLQKPRMTPAEYMAAFTRAGLERSASLLW
jgi:hypothetical protein